MLLRSQRRSIPNVAVFRAERGILREVHNDFQ